MRRFVFPICIGQASARRISPAQCGTSRRPDVLALIALLVCCSPLIVAIAYAWMATARMAQRPGPRRGSWWD